MVYVGIALRRKGAGIMIQFLTAYGLTVICVAGVLLIVLFAYTFCAQTAAWDSSRLPTPMSLQTVVAMCFKTLHIATTLNLSLAEGRLPMAIRWVGFHACLHPPLNFETEFLTEGTYK